MYNLDSLSLKYLINENKNFLNGAVVQKIQMPSKREILLSLRNLGENKKLYINVNPKFAHLNLIENKEKYFIKIPPSPPMFCMLLRKHIEGAKLNEVRTVPYERIVEFYFDIYDEIGSFIPMCLAVELMGKHSNAVLYNAKTKIISGCLHNISPEKSSVREVWGGIPYIYPPVQNKKDILKTSFAGFFDIKKEEISKEFYYLTGGLSEFVFNKTGEDTKKAFSFFQNLIENDIETVKEFWKKNIENEGETAEGESLNSLIEAYFSRFVLKDLIETRKSSLKKTVNREIKRQNAVILNSDNQNSYLEFKKMGDIILQNIYKIKKGDEEFEEGGLKVKLNPLKTPSENAQDYFGQYAKGKTAKEIKEKRAEDSKEALKYLEEILFSILNADSPDILDEIEEELQEVFSKKPSNSNKGGKEKPNIKKVNYLGFEILIGRNNKQNDYLIRKLSSPEDLWFHAAFCPSGHIIVKTENGRKKVPDEVLEYASKLTKINSPMKESAKASIIYTKRKFIKRPPDTHLGYVTYREEKEIVVS